MTEAFLHYIWQHQMLDRGLTTTDGQPVVVLRPGELNSDAGPDFFDARLQIGGVEWVGNVEVHIKSTDWMAHRHQHDAAYNNVILHVVYEHNGDVEMQNGKTPLTLELKPYMHPSLVANYDSLMSPDAGIGIPCARQLEEVPQFVRNSWLERLTVERIEAKTETVYRMLEESHGGWEQTCYWLLARYFGGKVNALAFELLAKATDLRLLQRWRDNRQRVEALLMGQAGLLEGYYEDDYPRRLQADYSAVAVGAQLKPIGSYLWKFYCLRPSNFPTVRISQFADLISKTGNLFPTLLKCGDVKELEAIFNVEASPYWRDHYRFDKTSEKSMTKRLGHTQAQLLIINAWIPLLFVYGKEHGQQQYRDQALALLAQIKPEDNAVMRKWKTIGMAPANAAESQALLLLNNEYCQNRRCLECRFGYHILKHK